MAAQPSAASRSTAFGYVCRRCSHCCRDKHIQLNPYEVARLARMKGISTGQFCARWTISGNGTALQQKNDGTCVFLGPQGCEVHNDRPLVCRLYPLGRHVRSDGLEFYTKHEGHPLSEGEFTECSTIADYLEAQGTKPYLVAQDGYFQWLCRAHEQVDLTLEAPNSKLREGGDDVDLLDIDSMIAKYCAATNEPEPHNIDDRVQLHLKLLYDVVANLEVKHVKGSSESCEDAS